ncbi:hypothetical protein FACS1894217_10630 [Clostridia bacterium]|nr:hypothetical protein FACS1894217_10630 [Clostridia bacterium]
MKRFLPVFIICAVLVGGLVVVLLSKSGGSKTPSPSPNASSSSIVTPASNPPQVKQFRGLWVSSVMNLDYPSAPNLSDAELKREADAILSDAAELGYNAIIFQVRPAADALYKSDLFPRSRYLGAESDFDPLAYWVEHAHALGLELHAWVNPLRVNMGGELSDLPANSPAIAHPEWVVKHSDGRMYFDPGIPEVRKLVVDGVAEILAKYDVDGIQFDDYFYPAPDFADSATFAANNPDGKTLEDWRRGNINSLIQELHEVVKPAVFGISPVGVWANNTTREEGSNTTGYESYSSQFADTRLWVKNNWIDYIAPQIYWNIGNKAADYATLVAWWSDVVTGTDVKLYIGQAIYRVGEGASPGDAWYDSSEIAKQILLNSNYSNVAGVIHFRYGSMNGKPALRETISQLFGGSYVEPPTVYSLSVGRPAAKINVTEENYYILGTSDGATPLYCNGDEVSGRSSDGFFGLLVNLSGGDNVYLFTQSGQTDVSVTISYGPEPIVQPKPLDAVGITNVYPSDSNEVGLGGEEITLSCTAPIGASVKVAIGGNSYSMTAAKTTSPNQSKDYGTTFSYKYTLPASPDGAQTEVGKPVYTMSYKDKSYSKTAANSVISLGRKAKFYATVTADAAFVYPNAATTGGPANEIARGQMDFVTAVTNNGKWVRLGFGGWVQGESVILKTENYLLSLDSASFAYQEGDKIDKVILSSNLLTNTSVSYDGNELIYRVANLTTAPKIPNFSQKYADGVASYTLKPSKPIDGYYMTVEDGKLTLNIKHHPKAAAGSQPLNGLTILLDPGHGGTDGGAIGCLGTTYSEKHINLAVSQKLRIALENLGAAVVMTRTGDETLSLDERVVISRNLRPDMFLSVHSNSMPVTASAENVRGLETYYRNNAGKSLSDVLYRTVLDELGFNERGSKEQNLYVNRPTWTPSALVETGFVCNVNDFSRLVSNSRQQELADSLANGIVKFFS